MTVFRVFCVETQAQTSFLTTGVNTRRKKSEGFRKNPDNRLVIFDELACGKTKLRTQLTSTLVPFVDQLYTDRTNQWVTRDLTA